VIRVQDSIDRILQVTTDYGHIDPTLPLFLSGSGWRHLVAVRSRTPSEHGPPTTGIITATQTPTEIPILPTKACCIPILGGWSSSPILTTKGLLMYATSTGTRSWFGSTSTTWKSPWSWGSSYHVALQVFGMIGWADWSMLVS
jgi:hypothetical protein